MKSPSNKSGFEPLYFFGRARRCSPRHSAATAGRAATNILLTHPGIDDNLRPMPVLHSVSPPVNGSRRGGQAVASRPTKNVSRRILGLTSRAAPMPVLHSVIRTR